MDKTFAQNNRDYDEISNFIVKIGICTLRDIKLREENITLRKTSINIAMLELNDTLMNS